MMNESMLVLKFRYLLVCLMEEISECLSENQGSVCHIYEIKDVSSVVSLLSDYSSIFKALLEARSVIANNIALPKSHEDAITLDPLAEEAHMFLKYVKGLTGNRYAAVTDTRALLLLQKFSSKIYRFEISKVILGERRHKDLQFDPRQRKYAEVSANLYVFFELLKLWKDIPQNEEKKKRVQMFCDQEIS